MKVVIDDCRLEKMDSYTEPLEAKIRRQAAEITRMLRENAELKKGREAIRDNAFEAGLIRGQEEAWKLAQKISFFERDGGYSSDELNEIFDSPYLSKIFSLTYTEAAAKVAEWERKKEEICVGDEVELINGVKFFVTYSCEDIVNGVSESGRCFEGILVQCCTKTGRHLDVDAWLAQIGGGSDE